MDQVAFFNHKGGVGKTTLLFNVGLAMANRGKTVLFIDADAQANLTSAALKIELYERALTEGQTIHACLQPVINNTGDIRPLAPIQIRDRAYILPGDIRLSAFEEILPTAWVEAVAGNYRGFQISSAMYRLVENLAAVVKADYALIDLGPNVGALNRAIMVGVEGFVVPLSPDLFSLTALPSVGKSTARWVGDWHAALAAGERADLTFDIALPEGFPSPLGYVSQQFVTYRSAPAEAFRRWIEMIPETYREGIVEPLDKAGIETPSEPHLLGEV
ncbi:MAG: ParA family protein, partial [Nocardioides sp.]